MANDLSLIVPTILKFGALALRQYAVMPRLVNTDFSAEVAKPGAIINVEIPSAVAARNVIVGTPPATDVKPTVAPIPLNNWKDAGFTLGDKEMREMDDKGMLVGQASEALKGLVNAVDLSIIANYKSIFGYMGAAGSVMDGIDDVVNVRKVLNQQLAPGSPRSLVIDGASEAALLQLNLFASKADSDTSAQITGMLGTRFGLDIVYDQNIESNLFTKGTGSAYVANGAHSAGATSLVCKTGSGTLVVGDIITVQGVGNYVVTAGIAAPGTATIYPGLRAGISDGATITVVNMTGQQNIGFHRDCFALASRPLDTPQGLGVISQSVVDDISGLALRLEVSRAYKQTNWSWDILWGTACVRPELGCRGIGS